MSLPRPRRPLAALAAAIALAGCGPSEPANHRAVAGGGEPAEAPTLEQCFDLAEGASEREDWTGVRDACVAGLELAPELPALLLTAAGAEARLGDTAASLAHLEVAARLGATADLAADDAYAVLHDRAEFQDLARRLLDNGRAQPGAEVHHRFADADLWPEGIAVDAATGDLYVGSIHRRSILRLPPGGSPARIGDPASDALMEVIGIWVDPARRELWAATGDGDFRPPFEGPPRKNELVRVDLAGDRLVRRYTVPDGEHRLLNDVVVGPDGTAWATESLRGEVYRVLPGGELELYRRFPELLFLNGLALSGDGRTLYLGHYGGLSAVDLEDGSIEPVTGPDMALGMVDGMSWAEGDLILVQNSRHVGNRVVRVELDAGGRRATRLEVLPGGWSEGLIPYTCAVADDAVFVVAGAPFGLMDTGQVPPAPAVVRIPLTETAL